MYATQYSYQYQTNRTYSWQQSYNSYNPYSTTSTRTTYKSTLWNPTDFFDIINPDPLYQCITCIGYASSKGRRCRNPINECNRAVIQSTLSRLSDLSPQDPLVAKELYALAQTALCQSNHQDQAQSIFMGWKQKLGYTAAGIKVEVKTESYFNRETFWNTANVRRPSQPFRTSNINLEDDEQEKERRQRIRSQAQHATEARQAERREEHMRAEKSRLDQEKQAKLAADKARAEAAKKLADAARERAKVAAAWITYQDKWTAFKISLSTPPTPPSTPPPSPSRAPQPTGRSRLTYDIPWPVKSGLWKDVKDSTVTEFMKTMLEGMDKGEKIKLLKKECLRWHPDAFFRSVCGAGRQEEFGDVLKQQIEMIIKVMTMLKNDVQGSRDSGYRE